MHASVCACLQESGNVALNPYIVLETLDLTGKVFSSSFTFTQRYRLTRP